MNSKIILTLTALMLTTAAIAGTGEGSGEKGHASGESSERSQGLGGDNEAGAVQFGQTDIYDQVNGGARLILAYDAALNAFSGTVENTLTTLLPNVRVEIHLSNGSELGPEFLGDLAPGQITDISLQSTPGGFVTWSAHPETGLGEVGSESAGGESGDPSSPVLALGQSRQGVVNGIQTSMSYNSVMDVFSGTVQNVTAKPICSVQIELNLKQGTKTVVELGPQPVGDLAAGGRKMSVELRVADEPLAANVAFDGWEIHPESVVCGGTAATSAESGGESHSDEGSEGDGEEHGSEGSGS